MNRKHRRLREKAERKEKSKQVSNLDSHVRVKKDLIPQLMSGMNVVFSSWMNVRMPEMLWGVLVVSSLNRDKALRFFRVFAETLSELPQELRPADLYLSDLGKMDAESLEAVLRFAFSIVPDALESLRPLLLFPELPHKKVWDKILLSPNENSTEFLMSAVSKTLNHQSQEATDCRWIRLAYAVLADKLTFVTGTEETLKSIMQYPNHGSMEKVRPSIRAAEIALGQIREYHGFNNSESDWTRHFWQFGLDQTPCLVGAQQDSESELDIAALQKEIEELRREVSQGFISTQISTDIDARHDGAFGLVLYAIKVAGEVCQPNVHDGSLGRIGLRTIVEIFITLSYLIKTDDMKKWEAYRSYGAGQAKLAFLKMLKTDTLPNYVDIEALEELANEDMWQEFVTINLGNWDSGNLRRMSESADEKEVYDAFYDWTSGYIHGQWAVVRDSTMTNCLNPLHRLHRVPKLQQTSGETVMHDVMRLLAEMIRKIKTIYSF